MRLTYGFLSVGEHVSLEHLLPLECLAAEVTNEGEGVGVQVQVPLEVPLQREALRALGALVARLAPICCKCRMQHLASMCCKCSTKQPYTRWAVT